MKKIIAIVLLCTTLMMSTAVYASDSSVVEDSSVGKNIIKSKEIDALSQLGVLDVTVPDSTVSAQTIVNGLNVILNKRVDIEKKYFENYDLTSPLVYGQAVMILLDVMGYTPCIEMYGYDKDDIISYIMLGKKINLIGNISADPSEPISVDTYSQLLYRALVKVPVLSVTGVKRDNFFYKTNKDITMLTKYMELDKVEGIVDGTNAVSGNSKGPKNSLSINGYWFEHNLEEDLFTYYGKYVEAFVDTQTYELKCILIDEKKNDVIKIVSDDISNVNSKVTSLSYQTENDKKKQTIEISPNADVVYNCELVNTYTRSDFLVPNAEYSFIDNNVDGVYEVVIIERFESFVIDSVSASRNTILDQSGRCYDLTEYFDNGYKLYDYRKKSVPMTMLSRYHVISYLKTKSGEMKYIAYTSDKAVGVFDEMRDDYKYVSIDGKEYKCSLQYYNNLSKFETITLGDRVTALLDINGYIVDIRLNDSTGRAAYVFRGGKIGMDQYGFHVLDDDSKIKDLYFASKLKLDEVRVSAEDVLSKAVFLKKGKFVPQLIIYKLNSDGKIISVDTAKKDAGLGKKGYKEFTLHYDSDKGGELKSVNLNGKIIVGTKYVLERKGKIFYINNSKEEYSMVIDQTSINTSSGMKLYNVNENYEAQYMVIDKQRKVGGWVDYYGNAYMVNEFSRVITPEGEEKIRMDYYEPDGTEKYAYLDDETVTSNVWNIFSKDERLTKIQWKDVSKGSVIMMGQDARGAYALALQHMPMEDNSELLFEGTADSATNSYSAMTEKEFGGTYSATYGVVLEKVDAGVVINAHRLTEEEINNGNTFPMESWNRLIPLSSSNKILLYDKSDDRISVESAECILPGDHIYIKRSTNTFNGVFVFRE